MIFNYFGGYFPSTKRTIIRLCLICILLLAIVLLTIDEPSTIKDFYFYTKIQITTSSEKYGKNTNYYAIINQKKFKTKLSIYKEINILNSITLFDVAVDNKKNELVAIQISKQGD